MPPRITQDPHLVQPPDFESEQFRALYATLATAERTVDAIIADSQNAWTQNNDAQRVAWNAQVEQDHAEEEEARAAQRRGKLRSTVGKLSSRRPSRYAIHKIEQLEYVELYYFTKEACLEAERTEYSVARGTFTLMADGENVLAKPAAAYKPSTKVVQDENLEWRQIIKAKDYMLEAMVDAGWPEEHVMALGVFFLELDKHPISDLEGGETAVLLYQARIRRRWMEDLKSTNDEEVFDISVVNDKRLDEMYSEVLNLRQAQGLTVSHHFIHKLRGMQLTTSHTALSLTHISSLRPCAHHAHMPRTLTHPLRTHNLHPYLRTHNPHPYLRTHTFCTHTSAPITCTHNSHP
ncbi:unnamed protein product [Cyclocybe aegerita]|uniref:Uncharacterized protein n=1 Tax=Cyclocybe aegerita TaxID=1973307 RepID=A0A8S0XZR7_CYCAE|nr:unnamed protein product [Cyclocybe aegerita]